MEDESQSGGFCQPSAGERRVRDRSPLRGGESGSELEERITRVVVRILGEQLGERSRRESRTDESGPSRGVEGRRGKNRRGGVGIAGQGKGN